MLRKITIFTLLILLAYIFSPASYIFAQESTQSTLSAKPEPVKYNLPYAGILPDNPLYSLKVLRDQIVKILIADPYKKAEFNLLNADKRLSAAYVLLDRGKDELVVTTLSKSNNYFHEAINQLRAAGRAGKDTKGLIEKFKASLKKHQEIAAIIQDKVDKKYKEGVKIEENRLKEFGKRVEKLQ